MLSKIQLVAAMKFLAKNNKNLFFKERKDEFVLYHDLLPFHATIMKLTRIENTDTWKVLDLSSKLNELNL